MAGQTNDENNTLYFDRLHKCERLLHKGSILQLVGGYEGGVKLRIKEPGSLPVPFLTLHSGCMLVGQAMVTESVKFVSEDGYQVHLYLNEFGIHSFKRLYIFTFFDEDGAYKFFMSYTKALKNSEDHPTFHQMMEKKEVHVEDVSASFELVLFDHEEEEEAEEVLETAKAVEEQRKAVEQSTETHPGVDGAPASVENEWPNELPLFDEYEESQDIFAQNCQCILPKKW